MNKFILCLLGAVLALAASCTSPLTSLVGAKSPAAAVLGPQDAQLVFQASGSGNRAVTGDTYLTVQLKSAADGTVKFASATGSNGSYTVTVGGMVAGDWYLKVMLYDSQASQVLKYYGNKTQYIAVGSTNNVTVPLYTPGTVNGVTFTDALLADHVTIMDPNGSTVQASPQPVVIGTSWDLDAQAYSSADDSTVATQPGVLWTSSNENVATVTANGRVFVQKKGTATITALSAENHLKTATYQVAGVPAVYGNWRQVIVNYGPQSSQDQASVVWEFSADTFVQYSWRKSGNGRMVRGDYTYEEGILKFTGVSEFDPLTTTWLAIPPGELSAGELLYLATVTTETMTFLPVQSLVYPSGPNVVSSMLGRANNVLGQLFVKVPDVALTNITLGGVASGGTISLPLGAKPEELTTVATPADATVEGLYWTTNDAATMGYDANGQFIAKAIGGPTTVTAYALNDLATPVATFTVNVTANGAPTVTLTSGTLYKGSAWYSLAFSDEIGTVGGSYTVLQGGTISNSSQQLSITDTQTASVSLGLSSGTYTLLVTAEDGQGNLSTTDFPFTVDSSGPIVQTPVEGAYVAGTPDRLVGCTITFTDVAGVDPATVVITNGDGMTISNGAWDAVNSWYSFDVNNVPTNGSNYTFYVTAKDVLGNQTTNDYFVLTMPNP